jgi:SAM-dependent methyltransferase
MDQLHQCPNCNSKNLRSYITAKDRHYGNKGEFSTAICKDCGLVFMNPMPNNSELAGFYPPATYYSFHESIQNQQSAFKQKLFKLLCINFPTHDPKFSSPGRIVDIGCGNGYSLVPYKNTGWEVYGVEPSTVAAQIGNESGLNIFCGTLDEAQFPDNHFDYIRSNHSFEHINNPNETLVEMKRVLKPGGKIFIGVPNIGGAIPKLFKAYWYYLGLPVHTFNYNPTTLSEMLTKHGFLVEKVYHNSTWAGILGSLQVYFYRNSNKLSGDGFLFKFKLFKPLAGVVARFLNLIKRGDCMEIVASKKIN